MSATDPSCLRAALPRRPSGSSGGPAGLWSLAIGCLVGLVVSAGLGFRLPRLQATAAVTAIEDHEPLGMVDLPAVTVTPEGTDDLPVVTVTPEDPSSEPIVVTVTPEASLEPGPITVTPEAGEPTADLPTSTALSTDTPSPTLTPTATRTMSSTPIPSPTYTPAAGTLSNISTRAYVGTGDDVMIGGFIVRNGQVKVILRALGPSLAASGVPNVLLDPRLRLFSGQTVIAANDNWESGNCRAEAPEGLWPKDPRESCLVMDLAAGPFTAIVDGVRDTTGIALVEAFHAGGPGDLSNISTRSKVRVGDEVMIGGFITRAQPMKAIVRGLGPSLAASGVPGPLQNPRLRLFSGQTVIAENDDWETGNCRSEAPSGLWPKDPREACLVITLAPGPYTAIVDGVGGTSGIGLVEVFNSGR